MFARIVEFMPKVEKKEELVKALRNEVLPILKKSCLACHNATQKESDLVLESPQSILKGGASGSAASRRKSGSSVRRCATWPTGLPPGCGQNPGRDGP